MSMRLADKDTVQLRFPVGTRVECNCGVWKAGTIVRHFYTQRDFDDGKCVPYQVRLDDGKLIFAPNDEDSVVRLLEQQPGGGGGRRRAKKAPVLPQGANEPSRFKVGDKVEVKISRNSEPGSPRGVEMISAHSIAGGRWVPAKVAALRYAQDDWCPGFYCAYAVHVHGDMTPDGIQYATPVREDDERCIRAAPVAPPPPPPRFEVGPRVECNGGQLGWRAGVVCEVWPEAPSGVRMPYRVELDGGGTALIPHDEDLPALDAASRSLSPSDRCLRAVCRGCRRRIRRPSPPSSVSSPRRTSASARCTWSSGAPGTRRGTTQRASRPRRTSSRPARCGTRGRCRGWGCAATRPPSTRWATRWRRAPPRRGASR